MTVSRPIPAEHRDLEARISAAQDTDTVRGFILRQACSTVRAIAGEAAAADCLAAVHRSNWIDFMSYPVSDCLRFIWLGAERLEPHLGSIQAALFRIGHDVSLEFLSSPLGKVVSTLAASDARRLMGILPKAYRMTVSYGDRTVTWKGPTAARLAFRGDYFNGPFHEGVLTSALSYVGAKNPVVRGASLSLLDMDYEATWS